MCELWYKNYKINMKAHLIKPWYKNQHKEAQLRFTKDTEGYDTNK